MESTTEQLDAMTDADLVADQARACRETASAPGCMDPRIPTRRAERLEKIAAKLRGKQPETQQPVSSHIDKAAEPQMANIPADPDIENVPPRSGKPATTNRR